MNLVFTRPWFIHSPGPPIVPDPIFSVFSDGFELYSTGTQTTFNKSIASNSGVTAVITGRYIGYLWTRLDKWGADEFDNYATGTINGLTTLAMNSGVTFYSGIILPSGF